MTMRIVFRADASLQMGSGHVMRCLTLADALTAKGAQCHFISRAHPGHLLEANHQRGYKANSLVASVNRAQAAIKKEAKEVPDFRQKPAHAAWLRVELQRDAADRTAAAMIFARGSAC